MSRRPLPPAPLPPPATLPRNNRHPLENTSPATHGATIIHPMSNDDIKRGDTVSKGGKVGTVIASSEGGAVVRWGGDVTLEKAEALAPAAAPVPVGLSPELREALRSWQVPR